MGKTDRPLLTRTDTLVFGYQALVCVIVFFGKVPGPRWAYWAGHLLFSAFLLLLFDADRRWRNPLLSFVRGNYPLVFITFFYMEAGLLVHAFFPWTLDPLLWEVDRALFGGGPALWAAQQASTPPRWLTEFFHLGYSFFYFLMPIAALSLWFKGPRERHATFMFSLTLTYFLHYLLFVLLPAHSPRLHDPALVEPLPGYAWSGLLKSTLREVAYPGGSFPSSHVAASVICFMAWRALGKWRFPVLFMTMVMFAGTVYGRYHYVVDTLTGLLAGLVLYRVAPWWMARWPGGEGPGASRGGT
jgi:membrane-associated phospholipid phosphatase